MADAIRDALTAVVVMGILMLGATVLVLAVVGLVRFAQRKWFNG